MPDPTAQTRPAAQEPPADPWATWDLSKATDAPDGLPDRAIVPLVESLRARGIVTLQSCIGHLAEQADGSRTGHDGGMWVRADSVDGAHIRLFLLREPFDRVQLVHWPELRWEFSWHPDDADAAVGALRGLLPAPAAPGPHPDTPEAHSGAEVLIIGTRWLDPNGDAWHSRGTAEFRGEAREVLLVRLAAGPVLKAALAWGEARDAWTDDPEYTTRANAYLEAERKLAAAVDAATSGQPTAKLAVASRGLADEGMTESSGHAAGPIQPLDLTDAERAEALAVVESRAAYCVQTTDNDLQAFAELPDCEACGGTGKQVPPDFYGPAESAPEPAGDGPGWDRPGIGAAENVLRRGGKAPGLADQLGALVAHFDLRGRMLHRAERERDAARAELAEVTAEQNRLFGLAERAMAERSDATAEVDRWVERHARTVAQLSDVRQNRDDQHAAATRLSYELEQTRAELITERGTGRAIARRDGAADALEWAAKETDRRIYDDGDAVAYKLSRLAAEVRSGEREIPTRQDGDSDDPA